ncbi:hypothetical protein PV04_10096 [Phialophora macrospora]|uniref:Uncharacterized protein n=1 Tax=Phialophora macrospora TaxID=1851006 RepID=A0A0D2F5Q0_9EURO|nr:hypothetical protein PV04_10096 [Phialophora macrospora]
MRRTPPPTRFCGRQTRPSPGLGASTGVVIGVVCGTGASGSVIAGLICFPARYPLAAGIPLVMVSRTPALHMLERYTKPTQNNHACSLWRERIHSIPKSCSMLDAAWLLWRAFPRPQSPESSVRLRFSRTGYG